MSELHTSISKVKSILTSLDKLYPDAECSLNYGDPLQLLVATILSAQCTDERVNIVTPELFRKYPSARDYSTAPIEEIEQYIRSTGFYHSKAKSIKESCRVIDERFDGQVPRELDTLVALPGIGRKTANVVLGNAFGIPGIVVDTHVARVTARLGLTTHKNPEKIEQELMSIIPKEKWTKFCHQVIQHGRKICVARKPKCSVCPLLPDCIYGTSNSTAKA
ncbi:MAG: endonuclease III [Syntrophobacteraceae bacterium]